MEKIDSPLRIYRGTKTNIKTQGFGANSACVQIDAIGQPIRPFRVVGQINGMCPPGSVPFYTEVLNMLGHNGEDWATLFRERYYHPVICEGVKWYSKDASDADGGIGIDVFGKQLIRFTSLPKEAGPEAHQYWHEHGGYMRVKFRTWHHDQVWKDQNVESGELCAFCDSTGASGGNHVHHSMKFVDDNDNTLDRWNGYYGAVSYPQESYFPDDFILDVLELDKKINKLVYIVELFQRAILMVRLRNQLSALKK